MEERLQQRRQGNRATYVPNPTMLFEQTYTEMIGQEGHVLYGLGHLEGCIRRLGSLALSKAAYCVYLIRSSWYPYCFGTYQARTNRISFICIHGPNVHTLWEFRLDEVIWSAHETMPHSVVLCHKTDPSRTAIHLVETWSRVCSYIEEVQRDRAKKSPPPIGNLEHADESERQPSSLPSGWADLDIFWPAMDMALPLVQEAPDGESGNPQPIGVLDRVVSWHAKATPGVELPRIEWPRALAANKDLSALSDEQMDNPRSRVPDQEDDSEHAFRKGSIRMIRHSPLAEGSRKVSPNREDIENEQVVGMGIAGGGEFMAMQQSEDEITIGTFKGLAFDQARTPASETFKGLVFDHARTPASADPHRAFVVPTTPAVVDSETAPCGGTDGPATEHSETHSVSAGSPTPQDPPTQQDPPLPQKDISSRQPGFPPPQQDPPLPLPDPPPQVKDEVQKPHGQELKGGWTPPSSRATPLPASEALKVVTFGPENEQGNGSGGWTAIDLALSRQPNPLEKRARTQASTDPKPARRDDKSARKTAKDGKSQHQKGSKATVQPFVAAQTQPASNAAQGKPPLFRPKPAEPPPDAKLDPQSHETASVNTGVSSVPQQTIAVVPALKRVPQASSVTEVATARGRLEGHNEELASKAHHPKAWKDPSMILDGDSQMQPGELAVRTASIDHPPSSPMSLYNHPSLTPRPAHASLGGEKHGHGRRLRIVLSRNSDPSAQGENQGRFDGPLHLGRVEFDSIHSSGKALRSCGGRKVRNGVTVGWEGNRTESNSETGVVLPAMPGRKPERALAHGSGEDGGRRRSSGELLPARRGGVSVGGLSDHSAAKEKRGGLLPWITQYRESLTDSAAGTSTGGKDFRKPQAPRTEVNVIRPSMILL